MGFQIELLLRAENEKLQSDLAAAKAEIEQMAAQLQVAREALKTVCDEHCNEWEIANQALAALSGPSAILAAKEKA